MIEWLLAERLPFCLVPTKMDKLKRGERRGAMVRILGALELPPDLPLIPYSSVDGEGRAELLAWLEGALKEGRTVISREADGGERARKRHRERTD
jgi:GTP-binding protein EngB required for normal cell division